MFIKKVFFFFFKKIVHVPFARNVFYSWKRFVDSKFMFFNFSHVVEKVQREGGKVLVHCIAGVSR